MTEQRDGERRRLALPEAIFASLVLMTVCAQADPAAGSARIASHQELAALSAPHSVRAKPAVDGKLLTSIDARRPITGERTVLPVLDRTTDKRGQSWLRVRAPGRALKKDQPPSVGWITANNTLRLRTVWHIVVDVQSRRVLVYRNGRKLQSYAAIVGKRTTPTPAGEYFVEENVRLPATALGAPFALATSARSRVLQEFAGGPGQIALHGLANIGGRLGRALSHGCIRLADGAISWLAARIRPGVPVTII